MTMGAGRGEMMMDAYFYFYCPPPQCRLLSGRNRHWEKKDGEELTYRQSKKRVFVKGGWARKKKRSSTRMKNNENRRQGLFPIDGFSFYMTWGGGTLADDDLVSRQC
jgi:hypothetical protein